MTESEWVACIDPTRMLGFVRQRLSERKQRLFAVACCRRIWPLFLYEDSRQAVEAAQRFAEGMARKNELRGYYHGGLMALEECAARFRSVAPHSAISSAQAAANAAEERLLWACDDLPDPQFDPAVAAAAAAREHARQLRRRPEEGARAGKWAEVTERRCQSDILRDIVGNPFRQMILDRSWLTWNGGVVKSLAEIVYEGEVVDRLPILADALEEAGCTDTKILEHLRGPGPHVKGCWVVDALLDKK